MFLSWMGALLPKGQNSTKKTKLAFWIPEVAQTATVVRGQLSMEQARMSR